MESLAPPQPRTEIRPSPAPCAPQPRPIAAEDLRAGKHLIFRLAGEDFGIRVTQVQEILGILEITSVPQTPAAIKGVINLRGRVIPVVDLRVKLGFPPVEPSERTCIVVVRGKPAAGGSLTGIVVDEVSEVLNLAPDVIQDTPDFGTSVPSPYILGIARGEEGVRILLDIEEVLTHPEPAGGGA